MATERRDLATIDAELAKEAENVRKMVGAPESKKITIDRDGNFAGPGGINLGNEINICVIDFCSANDYYDRPYNPQDPQPPVCFARGREIADMYPEEISPEPQSEDCAKCPHNQWGSRGNGKACKNMRNLAVVLEEDIDPESGNDPELHLIQVPPTALSSFDAAVLQTARAFNGPPIKAILTLKAVQKGTYTTMQFSSPEPNPHYADLLHLRDAAEDVIARLPDVSNYQPLRAPNRGRR